MNKYMKFLTPLIFILAGIIIFGVLISGCDVIKCYPRFDVNKGYMGIQCGGEF